MCLSFRTPTDRGEAIPLFGRFWPKQANWEHGQIHYNLGCCYEDVGDLVEARRYSDEAVRQRTRDPTFLVASRRFSIYMVPRRRHWKRI